ncbi:MAG: hypothetical protein ACRCXT_06210, partial [Paraclostridium sp.]
MKINSIKLKNYIGIYNGLKLEEIYIDFSKSKYKTVVIIGDNGSGKSTLFSAMHPLPDGNDKFISNQPAEKNIVISDDNIVYDILIKHPIKETKNGIARDTTKAYISKYNIDGTVEQLNPNGNVGSFKDVLFNELALDPNFVTLSQLSSGDRGLADKTPSERKRFVNSITNNLEVYNDIHKSLSKRSTIFKSMINSIVSKMDILGDKETILSTLQSLENRINKLLNDKDMLIEECAMYKSKVKLLDPDGSIQTSYDMIYTDLVNINNELDIINSKIISSLNKLNIQDINIDNIMTRYKDIENTVLKLDTLITVKDSEINTFLSNRETDANILQNKIARLVTLQSDIEYNDIDAEIAQCKANISNYLNIINMIGFDNIDNISKDEFIMGLNTIKDIKESIEVYKANMDYSITKLAIDHISNNTYPNIEGANIRLADIDNMISTHNETIIRYKELQRIASKLNDRHSDCIIPSCNFIKDAVIARDEMNSIDISFIESDIYNLSQEKEDINRFIMKSNDVIISINYLKNLARDIEKNSLILNKLPISNMFKNKSFIFNNILEGYDFNELDVLYKFIEYSNIIDEYKIEVSKL